MICLAPDSFSLFREAQNRSGIMSFSGCLESCRSVIIMPLVTLDGFAKIPIIDATVNARLPRLPEGSKCGVHLTFCMGKAVKYFSSLPNLFSTNQHPSDRHLVRQRQEQGYPMGDSNTRLNMPFWCKLGIFFSSILYIIVSNLLQGLAIRC